MSYEQLKPWQKVVIFGLFCIMWVLMRPVVWIDDLRMRWHRR